MSYCIKQKTKKYISRPGPPYPAAECPGQKKRGNTGKWYQSVPGKTGVYKWIPLVGITKKHKKLEKTSSSKQSYTMPELQALVKKWGVTKSGTKKVVATRLLSLRRHLMSKIEIERLEKTIKA